MKTIKQIHMFLFTLPLLFTVGRAETSFQDQLYDDFGLELTGFAETRQGWRLEDASYHDQVSISETRFRLNMAYERGPLTFDFKGELFTDVVEQNIDGRLRSLNVQFSPLDFIDVRMGRQTLTWGTGDLLFINDLFPKDWVSFFIGRNDEYLKAPSDAVRIGLFSRILNLEFVYMPLMNRSEYINGSRLSYWNGMLGEIVGENVVLTHAEREDFPRDGELSARMYRSFGSTEIALYGFYGFWKTPEGFLPRTGKLYFPRLGVGGMSIRTPLFGGIGNIEGGYYYSEEDDEGSDPFVRNSESRFLAGYERELANEFTGGFQYYLEWIQDYEAYDHTAGPYVRDEFRHLVTVRLTKQLLNQTLTISSFIFYSPTDNDAYWRPKVRYKVTDNWQVELGANVFAGEKTHTFFAQFEDNNNAYGSVRWSF